MKYLIVLMLFLQANSCHQRELAKTEATENTEETKTKMALAQLHDIWALSAIEGSPIELASYPSGVATLEIYLQEKSISGFSGCNQYAAPITEMTDKEISFGNVVATKKYCPSVNERIFFQSLEKVNKYRMEKLELILFEDSTEVLRFKKVD
ncbi:MAG: META domain-containing protein [Chitinophagales bacterium]|nr:META domain-containing protein [Bacteroidota bacterium]MCB9256851.1 META domain-containing protein [Chitinophagales bacterium]